MDDFLDDLEAGRDPGEPTEHGRFVPEEKLTAYNNLARRWLERAETAQSEMLAGSDDDTETAQLGRILKFHTVSGFAHALEASSRYFGDGALQEETVEKMGRELAAIDFEGIFTDDGGDPN